jgi:hypothetical protein
MSLKIIGTLEEISGNWPIKMQCIRYEHKKEDYNDVDRFVGSELSTRATSQRDRYFNQYWGPGILLWPELLG